MNPFHDITVTAVEKAFIVHSEKGKNFQMECRPSYGLSFCESGQITYTMNGKTYVSDPDHAVLLPKGGTYSLYGEKEGRFPVVNFQCEKNISDEIVVFSIENLQACLRAFESLKRLFFCSESRLKIFAAFYMLLEETVAEDAKEYHPLRKVLSYIEENLSDPGLSNTKLAERMNISEVYLRKLFRQRQNCTPRQYVLNRRIQKAKEMLVETPDTVTAVAEACGFGSLYHFCRAFKEKTGMSPTEYATRNRIFQI